MFVKFGKDLNAWKLDTQYMLGSELLVAPVLEKEGEVRFYIPETGLREGRSGGPGSTTVRLTKKGNG